MAYVAVTLQYGNEKHDLALPLQVPSRLVVDGILKALKFPRVHGQNFQLGFQADPGVRPISPNASLGDAGILHGAVLVLLEQKVANAPPLTGAYLKNESGVPYPLTARVTLIGRSDPKSGVFVEIDLASLAADAKAVSRRHAQLEQEGDRFYLVDLGSVNGTRLNGTRIPPQEKKPVWDGDVIEFGRGAVRLTFCAGGKKP
jgi:pSer/pThr/pTyr-binding forkhead associated (FHA) protein